MMQCPRILVITGPRGSGKTSMVRTLASRGVAGAAFYHLDPSQPASDKMAPASSTSLDARIENWISRLAESSGLSVLEGEIPLSAARAALGRYNVDAHFIIVKASDPPPGAKTTAATQSDSNPSEHLVLNHDDLRDVAVIDTSQLTIEQAIEELHQRVSALAAL